MAQTWLPAILGWRSRLSASPIMLLQRSRLDGAPHERFAYVPQQDAFEQGLPHDKADRIAAQDDRGAHASGPHDSVVVLYDWLSGHVQHHPAFPGLRRRHGAAWAVSLNNLDFLALIGRSSPPTEACPCFEGGSPTDVARNRLAGHPSNCRGGSPMRRTPRYYGLGPRCCSSHSLCGEAMSEQQSLAGLPDLTQGIGESDLVGGKLVGRVGDSEVLLVRSGSALFAVGARCSHYQGPLAEGIVVADTVRCPWHHACFDLRNGEAVRAPALTALDCWAVEIRGGRIYVTEKSTAPRRPVETPPASPNRIVIVGGGAAGFAAAEMLRRCGFAGSLVMLSQDDDPPVDRPNLSKDFLAGSAPEDWVPLRPDDFYQSNGIELRLNTEVVGIDVRQHAVQTADGQTVAYDRLLLAMGAEPVRLTIPGAERPHVYTLRSLRDCRAIIARATAAQHAVVVGASFIGLEVAASLRTRGLAVHVVAPESRPMERIFGPEMADFVRDLHEQHGVAFHLQDTVTAIDENSVRLRSGSTLKADLVIVGVGVRPRITLAEK